MINLKSYISSKNLFSGRVLAAIGVAAGIMLLFFYYFPRSEYGVKLYFSKQLGKLNISIESISKDIEKDQDTKSAIEAYDKNLSEPLLLCKKIQTRYRKIENRGFKQQTKEAVEGANKMCEDLIPILNYSKELYSDLAPYLLYDTGGWPPYENEEFGTHLAETQGMISTTLSRLERINNTRVDDPALGELVAQVKSAEKIADESYTALTKNDEIKAQALTEQLRKDLQQDKSDFLNARQYFWNNTVQVDSLRQVLDQLIDRIKS